MYESEWDEIRLENSVETILYSLLHCMHYMGHWFPVLGISNSKRGP